MTRVVMFGVDQMILPLTERLMEERDYPNLERVLKGGAVTEAIPCWPAWTPTNWATIATGADPGAHGVFGWEVLLPDGDVLTSFHSGAIRTDTLWEAADRAGMRVGLVHYPASWPSRLTDGFVIDGCALPDYGQTPFEIAPGRGYTTNRDFPISDRVEFTDDEPWSSLADGGVQARTGVLEVRAKSGDAKTEIPFAVVGGTVYDGIILSLSRSRDDVLAKAAVGEWSDWLIFEIGGVAARCRIRLVEIDEGSGDFHVWRSQVLPLRGYAEPDSIMDALEHRLGAYHEHVSEIASLGGAADYETVADEARYQLRWFAGAMLEMLNEHGCSLVGFHWHWLDWVNHLHLGHIDPAWSRYDEALHEENAEIIHDAVAMIDEGLGIVLEGLDDDDVLVLLADHGNLPVDRMINFRRLFVDTGRTTLLDPDGEFNEENTDWERTEVFIPDRLYAPDISVNPAISGAEKRRIVAEVVNELRVLIDPQTGLTPVAVALPKGEAAVLGWYGPDSGDIMMVLERGYAWDSEEHIDAEIIDEAVDDSEAVPHWHGHAPAPVFSDHPPPETAAHGHCLPTSTTGISSNMAILAMIGGPIQSGYRRDPEKLGPAWLKDVAPTVAHLLGIDPPRQSSGGILYDFLGVDPGVMTRDEHQPQRYRVPRDQVDTQLGMHDFSLLKGDGSSAD